MSNHDYVEIDCEVLVETEHAYKIFDGATEAWVPKSQVSDFCDEVRNGRTVITSIFIPEWLANKKGLI